MPDVDFIVEAKRVKKELVASLKSKDALLKALKVSCRAEKYEGWVHIVCLGSWQIVHMGCDSRL